jgi:hypothetical protein
MSLVLRCSGLEFGHDDCPCIAWVNFAGWDCAFVHIPYRPNKRGLFDGSECAARITKPPP